MLAMVVNDDAGSLNDHGVLKSFASLLAPTVLISNERLIRATGDPV
jgi:hypothetical protein